MGSSGWGPTSRAVCTYAALINASRLADAVLAHVPAIIYDLQSTLPRVFQNLKHMFTGRLRLTIADIEICDLRLDPLVWHRPRAPWLPMWYLENHQYHMIKTYCALHHDVRTAASTKELEAINGIFIVGPHCA